jgi:hypothetical protein
LAQLSPEEQRVLEVASVAGVEFSAAVVAACLATAVEEAEERCAGLARRTLFVQPCGLTEWPDGTVAARYAFLHALYAHVLYERLTAGRCRALHVRLGQRLEQAYGAQTRDVSAELALHFERGREYSRAIPYLRQTGENASRWGCPYRSHIPHVQGVRLNRTIFEGASCYCSAAALRYDPVRKQ